MLIFFVWLMCNMYSLLASVENDGDISIGGSVGEGIGNKDESGHRVLETALGGIVCTDQTMTSKDDRTQPWPKCKMLPSIHGNSLLRQIQRIR